MAEPWDASAEPFAADDEAGCLAVNACGEMTRAEASVHCRMVRDAIDNALTRAYRAGAASMRARAAAAIDEIADDTSPIPPGNRWAAVTLCAPAIRALPLVEPER